VATPYTAPVDAFTLATEGADDDHVPPDVPLASVVVVPTQPLVPPVIDVGAGVVVINTLLVVALAPEAVQVTEQL
jgi:hypothetical protein